MVLPTKFARRRAAGIQSKSPRVDFGRLKEICKRPENDFHVFKGIGTFEKHHTPAGAYYYKDNGAKVLMVAHLDSVNDFHWAGVLNFKHQTEIYCTTLDDRLGVYITLDLLKQAGLEYDILLTTNEETGNSSAQWFEPPKGKKYNWIAEFDRAGTDTVTYQYHDTKWRLAIDDAGFEISHGTYSDIADLNHLGVCGVNIGTGYHRHHYTDSYAVLHEIQNQVSKFIDFYKINYEVEFEYAPLYNVLTNKGLTYSPHIIGKFTRDEYDIALDLYEQIQAGQSFESLGYAGLERLTPENINIPKKSTVRIIKHPTLVEKEKRDEASFTGHAKVEGPKMIANHGSEDDTSKQRFVVFPKAMETTAKEVAEDIESKGFKATITEKCIECGTYYSPAQANTTVFCPICDEIVGNRHAKDTEESMFANKWDIYKKAKKTRKANQKAIPPDKEALEKLADKQIGGALAQLNHPELTAQELGIIMRMVREEIPHELAKPVFDELVKEKRLKEFKVRGELRSYPDNPANRAMITHAAVVALMVKEDLSEELKASGLAGYQKWLSRMEQGHAAVWRYGENGIDMLEAYFALLALIVEDKWLDVINRATTIDFKKLMKEYDGGPRVTPIPDKPVVKDEESEEGKDNSQTTGKKLTLTIKFKLDKTNRADYDLKIERSKGIIYPKWERVKIEKAATA